MVVRSGYFIFLVEKRYSKLFFEIIAFVSKIITEVIKLPVSIRYARDKTYWNPIYPWKEKKLKFLLLDRDSSSRSCDKNVVFSSKEKYSSFK